MALLEIDTNDEKLVPIFKKDKPENVSISFKISFQKNTGGTNEILGIIIEYGVEVIKDIGIPLFCSWLYDKLKNSKSKKITINHKEVYIDKDKITKIVEDTLKDET